MLDRLRRAVARLRPARKPPTPAQVFKQALLDEGVPSDEVRFWYQVVERSAPTWMNAQQVAGYCQAGFTPAQAQSWIMCAVVSPTPAQAYRLHQMGWTGWDYSTARNRFPSAWVHRMFMSPDMVKSDAQAEDLLVWVRSPLPGWVSTQYVLAGVTLAEALDAWEPVRAHDEEQWGRSVQFLQAFHDTATT